MTDKDRLYYRALRLAGLRVDGGGEMRGDPREQYKRTYWVVPPSADASQRAELYRLAAAAAVTVGPSYDDAGIGALDDKTAVLFGVTSGAEWNNSGMTPEEWYARNYPGTRLIFKPIPGQEPEPDPDPEPDPEPLPHPVPGAAKIGLHMPTDSNPPDGSYGEFAELRPGVIKALSSHDPAAIARLAREHPSAVFILRAFLSFGGRAITYRQFFNDTISDVLRSLEVLRGREVWVELHNEPNLVVEGLEPAPGAGAWCSGKQFNLWYLSLLDLYRRALPHQRFVFPGLSPQPGIKGSSADYVGFFSDCKEAIRRSDALGVHAYWRGENDIAPAGLEDAVALVRWYAAALPGKPVWVTEASNNRAAAVAVKARQYVRFWLEMQKISDVRGVTYFAAASLDPKFATEVWYPNGTGKAVRKVLDGIG